MDVEDQLRKSIYLPSEAGYAALTLWIIHTHALPAFVKSPRLLFTSPGPGCGKTEVLKLLKALCARADYFTVVTEAALIRFMDETDENPHTILIDEADTFFANKPKLRSVLNSSYEGGQALISLPLDSGGWEAGTFKLRAPVAVAGIGDNWTWAALRDRSIQVKMQKPPEGLSLKTVGEEDIPKLEALESQAAAWALRMHNNLKAAAPQMPDGVANRDADKWRPLIAIADAVGGDWPKRARSACESFVHPERVAEAALLHACMQIFTNERKETLSTEDLLRGLNSLDEQPWAKIKGQLSSLSLSALLRPKGIEPTRFSQQGVQRRGYARSQFVAALDKGSRLDGLDDLSS